MTANMKLSKCKNYRRQNKTRRYKEKKNSAKNRSGEIICSNSEKHETNKNDEYISKRL